MIIKLTEAYVANSLQCPPGKKRAEVCDDGTGMYIELRSVSPGQGTYYLRYKDSKGKTCHQRIGKTTEISLTDARKQAKTLKAEIELGADPRGEEKARNAVMTLDDYWINRYSRVSQSMKRSYPREEQLYRLRIKPRFGHLKLSEITRQQLQSFHIGLKEEGLLAAASCDLHLKLLKVILGRATEDQLISTNPASRLPLFNEDNRVENYLNAEQLQKLLAVLHFDRCKEVSQIARILLLSGARLNEILTAKWRMLDRAKCVLKIEATNSKSRRSRYLYLNQAAMEIINQLDTEGKYEYLFINRKTGKPYVNIHKVWYRLRKEAGLPHLRIHDLRHGFCSLLAANGVSMVHIMHLMGHSSIDITNRYIHLSGNTLHFAASTASDVVNRAMQSVTQMATESPATTEAP